MDTIYTLSFLFLSILVGSIVRMSIRRTIKHYSRLPRTVVFQSLLQSFIHVVLLLSALLGSGIVFYAMGFSESQVASFVVFSLLLILFIENYTVKYFAQISWSKAFVLGISNIFVSWGMTIIFFILGMGIFINTF